MATNLQSMDMLAYFLDALESVISYQHFESSSVDCMYGTRNVWLSHEIKRDRFSDLLSTMTQKDILDTYIEPKPLWQDTHEVSQGLEHDTLVN